MSANLPAKKSGISLSQIFGETGEEKYIPLRQNIRLPNGNTLYLSIEEDRLITMQLCDPYLKLRSCAQFRKDQYGTLYSIKQHIGYSEAVGRPYKDRCVQEINIDAYEDQTPAMIHVASKKNFSHVIWTEEKKGDVSDFNATSVEDLLEQAKIIYFDACKGMVEGRFPDFKDLQLLVKIPLYNFEELSAWEAEIPMPEMKPV